MLGEEGTNINVDWIVDMLNRRKWWALVTFLCLSTAGISIVTWLPEIFISGATVIVEQQQIPAQLVQSTVTSTVETRLKTITEETLIRSRLEELINRFELYPESIETVPMERLVGRMRGDMWLDLRQEGWGRNRTTVAFNVRYRGGDPDKVAAVANALAGFYVEGNVKARAQQAAGTSAFLSAQLEEMAKRLDEQEKRLSRFKQRHLGELPHQQEANFAALEHINTQLQGNLASHFQVSERRATLVKEMAEAQGFVAGGTDPTMAQYTQMKQELAQLQTEYTAKHPDVVRLTDEIAALESRMHGVGGTEKPQFDDLPESPYVAELKKSIADEERQRSALEAEAATLRESIEKYGRRVENAPRVEQQYQVLSRGYETIKERYRTLLVRQQEAELAEDMENREKGEQFRLIESARASNHPAAPNRPLLRMVALALSLGLAAGVVLLVEYLDSSFHSVDELRRFTDVRLLGSIPQIVTSADRTRWKWKFALGAVSLALGLMAIATCGYLFAEGNTGLTSRLL